MASDLGVDGGAATMSTRFWVLLGPLALAACGEPAANPLPKDGDTARVQGDVERCVRAVYGGDVDSVLRLTHPVILEKLGGADRARSILKESLRRVAGGMSVESFSFPRDPDFLAAGQRRFAVVPTLMVLEVHGQRLESLNYQLGVLDPGLQDWKYVEGSRVNGENVHSYFPDFPSDYKFPDFYRKKL